MPPRTHRRHLAVLASRRGPLDVLDWGCGPAAYRPAVEALGHRYVGVDGAGPDADVRAELHALPFADAAIDHVVTNAVLEHVANPFRAVYDVARVLRPGGVFSGSVAFLEPSHHGSRLHFTADGVTHVLAAAGLRVEGLWPQEGWLVFDSLASMPGPVSRPTRRLLALAGTLERALRRRHLHPRALAVGRWLRRKTVHEYREELLTIAGQVDFVARKP